MGLEGRDGVAIGQVEYFGHPGFDLLLRLLGLVGEINIGIYIGECLVIDGHLVSIGVISLVIDDIRCDLQGCIGLVSGPVERDAEAYVGIRLVPEDLLSTIQGITAKDIVPSGIEPGI